MDQDGAALMRYAHQLGIAIDQMCNAILAGFADETLSARAFRSARRDEAAGERSAWSTAERVIDALFVWQDWLVRWRGQWTGARHCERAYLNEVERAHYPPSYRSADDRP